MKSVKRIQIYNIVANFIFWEWYKQNSSYGKRKILD